MDDYEMDDEELNGIMKYEFKRVSDSDILEYGFEIKLEKDSPNEEERDYTKWNMIMKAPDDSDYKGGYYYIDVEFVKNYPYKNPKFKFKTPIYHCNVKENGELNVNWMLPGMKIDYIMPRLLTLFYLQDPSVDPNSERSKLYNEDIKKNKEDFKKKIRKNVEEEANKKLTFKEEI